MPGPGKKKNAIRRNLGPDWKILPAAGFDGDAPMYPFKDASVAEDVLWLDLWRTPQAQAWSEFGWTRVIARYCRLVIQTEGEDVTAALLAEVRQMEDRLGLTPLSMKRLQWEVSEPAEEVAEDSGDNVHQLFG